MKIEIIERVSEIFAQKSWELDETNNISKFNLFCQMLKSLKSDEEVNLMIELLEDFLEIEGKKYDEEIVKILNQFLICHSNLKTLFVLPLIPETDIGKIKSAHTVLYKFKGRAIKYNVPKLKEIGLSVLDNLDALPLLLNDNQMIILVDDFIGTGETSISAIEYLKKKQTNLDMNKIAIFSIAIQKTGLENLNNIGLTVFYSKLIGKGVSDKYVNKVKDEKLNLMQTIEDRLKKLEPEFRFGYKQSEALISMERTPNNTFPIFWYNYKKKYYPPFPR